MTGYQFSLMNYDTLSTNPANIMNLHSNQVAEHMQTWPALFQTQQYGFDCYTPYGSSYSNTFLLDPRYTLMQASWGTPAWNNGPWNNPNGGWNNWSPWGGNCGGSSSSSSSSSTDPEQIEYKEKYDKLSKLAKQLQNYEGLSGSEKRTLSAAINDTKGTNQEKFERLLKAYKSISKDTVKTFLAEEASGLAVVDPSTSAGKDSSKNNFYSRLTNTGFEYKNTATDDEVENFYNSIKNDLGANDGNASTAAGVVAKVGSTIDVLDFISSYNSNYKNKTGSTRIIDHISANWSSVKGEMRSTLYSTVVDPLIDALISKAQDMKKYLDEDSQEYISTAIEDLETAKSKSTTSIDSSLSTAFDKLYLLTRSAAMEKFKNDAIAYYGEIDSSIFNKNLFDAEYRKDLEEEGFEDSEIEDAEVSLSDKEAKKAKRGSESEDVEEAEEVEETPEEKEAKEKKKAERQEREAKKKEEATVNIRAEGASLASDLSGYTDSSVHTQVNATLEGLNADNIMDYLEGYYIDGNNLGATEGLIEKLDDEHDNGIIAMENKKNVVDSLLSVAEEVGLKNSANYKKLKKIMDAYKNDTARAEATTFNHGGWARLFNGEGWKYTAGNAAAGAATGAAVVGAVGKLGAGCASSGPLGWIIGGVAAAGAAIWACVDKVTDNEVIDKHMEALFQEIEAIKAKQAK